MEHRKHVIFYRPTGEGIHVIRILHQGMLPHIHFEDLAKEE